MGSASCKSCSSSSTANELSNGTTANGTYLNKQTSVTADGTAVASTSGVTTTQQPEADTIVKHVCNVDDIQDNEMKTFELDDESKVLLIKQKGELSAIGTKCSHYGALLSTGALGDGRIRCPWHGACFNIKTGDIEDFPTQDSIPCFKVQIEDNKVKVHAKKSDLQSMKRLKNMVKRDARDERTFIIIGGGPSGGICAETLRQEGFTGRIVVVCKEEVLPYDRIMVSKAMGLPIERKQYRTVEFYEEYDIDVLTGTEATKVDTASKIVSLDNGYQIRYTKLYIATGSQAKKAPVPGADLKNVVTMRTHADGAYVQSLLNKEAHVVCLGLSFIGLEAAAYCVPQVAKVTIVGRDTVPLRQSFGEEIGQRVKDLFEEKGVEFALNNGIKRCIDENGDGVLTAVELNDGRILKCDVCIMGTGSSLYTKFLDGSGIRVNPTGSIDTNIHLESNISNVFVGGDIANAPVYSIDQQLASIGHYPLAQYHGRIAGLNMAGKRTELRAVPYFWTVLFGKSFRYSGHGNPHETHIVGDLKALKFVAFFCDAKSRVVGMASCDRDPVVSQFAELQAQGKRLYKANVLSDPFAWASRILP